MLVVTVSHDSYHELQIPHQVTRTSINKQLERRRLVVSRQKTFVETIEPSGDALSMELGVTSELEFAV
jgi:hypothetical protein